MVKLLEVFIKNIINGDLYNALLERVKTGKGIHNDEKLVSVVASAINDGVIFPFNKHSYRILDSVDDSDFFCIQTFLCKLIPKLRISSKEIVILVDYLVVRCENDYAIYAPYKAFREWLVNCPDCVQCALNEVNQGDKLQEKYLRFYLETLNDIHITLSFLKVRNSNTVLQNAITAVGKLIVPESSADCVMRRLIDIANYSDCLSIQVGVLTSSYRILNDNKQISKTYRTQCMNVLRRVSSSSSNQSHTLLAHLLHSSCNYMWKKEIRYILSSLEHIEFENKSAIRFIDWSLGDIVKKGMGKDVICFLKSVIINNRENDILLHMSTFEHDLIKDESFIRELIVDWFIYDNLHLHYCLGRALTSCASRQHFHLALTKADLPESPSDQLVLCKRFVAHLMTFPIISASFLVSIIENCHNSIFSHIIEILWNPLLLCYGKTLIEYFSLHVNCKGMNRSRAQSLKNILMRANNMYNAFDEAKDIFELRPSDHRKKVQDIQMNEDMNEVLNREIKKSPFFSSIESKNIAYGASSSSYIRTDKGELSKVDVQITELSYSKELPLLSTFDPVGLELTLVILRASRRT